MSIVDRPSTGSSLLGGSIVLPANECRHALPPRRVAPWVGEEGTAGTVAVVGAGKMGLPAGQWRLLTAPDEVVRPVADMVGFRYQRIGREFSHNAVIAVADAQGEIVGWFADERIRDAELLGRGLAMALSM